MDGLVRHASCISSFNFQTGTKFNLYPFIQLRKIIFSCTFNFKCSSFKSFLFYSLSSLPLVEFPVYIDNWVINASFILGIKRQTHCICMKKWVNLSSLHKSIHDVKYFNIMCFSNYLVLTKSEPVMCVLLFIWYIFLFKIWFM